MSNIENALAFIDEGIEALSIEMYRAPAEMPEDERMKWTQVDPIEATIAVELERIDSALGPRGQSMFAPMAESVKQAMMALHGAKQALSTQGTPHA